MIWLQYELENNHRNCSIWSFLRISVWISYSTTQGNTTTLNPTEQAGIKLS
jgi:hypothetical protein